MREASLENHFYRGVRRAGGTPVKMIPVVKGTPDRLVLWPGGRIELVELKTETGRVSPAQRVWHDRAAELGVTVAVLRGAAEVDAWIEQHRQTG